MYRHPNGAINQQELAKIKRGQRSRLFKFLSRALWPDENATKRGDEIARLFGVNAKKVNNIRQGASHLPAETDLNELHRSIDELVKAVDDPNVTAA